MNIIPPPLTPPKNFRDEIKAAPQNTLNGFFHLHGKMEKAKFSYDRF